MIQKVSGKKQAAWVRASMRKRPLAQLIAVALAMSTVGTAHAAAPPAFSQAWFASRQPGATPSSAPSAGANNGNNVSYTPGSALLQQRVQQSIQNLNNAAAALASQMQQQKQAQAAAAQLVSNVPNGLADGGLTPASGIATDPTLWQNALQPTDTVAAGGKHTVEVKQTAKKAILTWDSFNVGRDTTLYFNQSGGNLTGGGNDWIALNRVNDPTASPSQILGQMKAEGTVYILNRNGVIFGQGAQVNTHSLVASSMYLFSKDLKTSNDTFFNSGIIDSDRITQPTFVTDSATPNGGSVVVEKGASINAGSDGFVIVAAPQVTNRGSIIADDGQVVLASARQITNAGTSDALELGVDPLAPQGGLFTGGVENSGLIQARRGSITIFGPHVAQDGVVVTSTSISRPGSISIQGAQTAFSGGPVEFGTGSVTAVLPEKDGASTTSTADADKVFVPGSVTVTGLSVTLDGGSLIEVPGGKVSLQAISQGGNSPAPGDGRVYIDSGATIDVSGLANVELPMSALLVSIPRIGQNELADSPLLRNSFLYTQKNILLDSTVSGTRADGLDWIGSPILNAAGYVENMPRDIDQMLTRGGSITLDGNEVIARTGSRLALDGGYLAYQSGWITTPNLLGADGRIYNIASADPNVDYVGFAGQYTSTHARWGVSETYNSPLMGGTRRYQEGFVKGADAGTLTVHANVGLALDGEVSAQATPGTQQTGNGTEPDGGTFAFDMNTASLGGAGNRGLRIQQMSRTLESLSPGFDRDTQWSDVNIAAGLDGAWMVVSADTLGKAGFSTLDLTSETAVEETAGTHLVLQPGGSVSITGSRADIYGSIEAPAGNISIATGKPTQAPGQSSTSPFQDADITLYDGALLSARGEWVNDSGLDAEHAQGSRWIDGGNVTLTTDLAIGGPKTGSGDGTGSIVLAKDSVVDVSGGGYVDTRGNVSMDHGVPAGRGGDITLQTYLFDPNVGVPQTFDHSRIELDGTLRSWGFSGGGALTLRAAQIQVGGDPADMALSNGLWLSPDFFTGQGFSRYNLDSVTDATVADGASVVVRPANLLGDIGALRGLPTGADLYATPAVSGPAFLDGWHRWATRGLSADSTPGLTISAGDYLNWFVDVGNPSLGSRKIPNVSGSATIGEGAVVEVDAGGLIDISAQHNVDVDGGLTAHGGAINLTSLRPSTNTKQTSRVRVGSDAVLDASGIALVDSQAAPANGPAGRLVPRVGDVLAGGSVALSGVDQTFVIADDGARIDVSGAADTFDLPSASRRLNGATADVAPTAVWSDAGSIVFGASAGLYIGATLDAHGGAPSAEGGSLQVVALDDGDELANVNAKGILVRQSQRSKPAFAADDAIDGGVFGADGTLEFAADVLNGSGISSLQFGPGAGEPPSEKVVLPLGFAGDVNLDLGRQVVINSFGIEALPATATHVDLPGGYVQGAGQVTISAPYVHVTGTPGAYITNAAPVVAAGDGIIDVNAATIDMGGVVNLQGWRQASFNAKDDLRFTLPALYASTNGLTVSPGMLFSTGDLAFSAGQVYPTSGYRFAIDANASGLPDADGNARETSITFLPSGNASTTPLSAGGALLVSADHIEQQGTIRVPSGTIVLGTRDPATDASDFGLAAGLPALAGTKSVHLAPGSITSVSLDGLTVPYGNTIDGVDWRYALNPHAPATIVGAPPAKQIEVAGDSVALDAGATIDLDGGGHLQGSEFVPGTGGTRDLLTTAPNGATVYAILPGYHGAVAATDMSMDASGVTQPGVGRQVYLSGVPGLAAGYYTLLPAQYATLPGAMRIYQDTTSRDAVVGRAAAFVDGGYAVGGYYGDALTGAHDARTTTFVVQSAATWQQYSQYRLTDADTFFNAAATKKGQVAPPLAADAGRLQIGAGHELDLGATLDATPGTGGRTSQVDIAGQAIQVLGAGETARDGYLAIAADGLTTLGAGSLLLGGTRRSDTDGDHVDVTADSILLSNDAAHPLAGQEILLVAGAGGDGITLEDGSVLAARGAGNLLAGQPLVFGRDPGTDASGKPIAAVDGNGALLRVSQNGVSPISRLGLAAGSPGGALTIGSGATVDGGNALSLDATGPVSVDDSALLAGKNIDATANRIAFVGTGATAPDDGLVIGAVTLAQWRSSDSVTLRSRGNIDFLGAQDVSVDNGLVLSAGALTGDGHDVSLHAGTITFANVLGAAAGNALAGGGTLSVNAGEIDFGQGTASLHGFGAFDGVATSGFVAAGQGGVDFGAASVDLSAPVFVAASGSATTLLTTGAMRLHGTQGTALSTDGLGGALNLRAASIDDGMNLTAAAGNLTLDAAQGGVHVASGTTLDVGGVTRQFFDTAAYAPGGNLALTATGDIAIDDGASMRYGGATEAGDAGTFKAIAGGALLLGGSYDGHAAQGYRGGYFTIGTGGALDLDTVAGLVAASGSTGLVDITSGQGDLALSAGTTLRSNKVYLYANGGNARIDGTVDASSPAGSHIEVWALHGVDINGTLDAHVTTPEQRGGDIVLGTTGSSNGSLDPTYGYEVVDRADAGYVHVGAGAQINVSGGADTAFAGGRLSIRAPLLADGDVPITIDNPASIKGARDVTIEPFAVWSTKDGTTGAQHFDGVIDPAGWFTSDGKTMVAGTWNDGKGNVLPPPADTAQQATYMDQFYFTPDAINADHAGFYGYADGDPANGPGTLMGFVEQPGFTFGNRFDGIANVNVRPGIELRNPIDGANSGNIEVVTNWNLGAGVTGTDGKPQLAYRYNGEAPILTVRAAGNLDLKASITDGFYQQNNGAQLNDPPSDTPSDPLYDAAVAEYQVAQAYLDQNNAWNGTINLADGDPSEFKTPGGGVADISKDPYYQPLTAPSKGQVDDYYANYNQYIFAFGDNGATNFGWSSQFVTQNALGFLTYNPHNAINQTAPSPANYTTYDDYANAYVNWLFNFPQFQASGDTPSPLLLPVSKDYTTWSHDYGTYLGPNGYGTYLFQVSLFMSDGTNSQLFYAPFAPREDADTSIPPTVTLGKPAPNNAPSNMPTFGNATSLASATLLGGSSTSYRFVAGTDLGSVDPLATAAASGANITLDGHFAVKDTLTDPTVVTQNGPFSGKTIFMPTTIRTGTGDIDMVSAGDIQWLDAAAPATIYTAGAPADGTTAGTDVNLLRPSELPLAQGSVLTAPDALVTGLVNPDHAGDVYLKAGGDISSIQNVVDVDGSQTKAPPGNSVAQYWWQWMQTGNAADGSSSSINFGNFHQGVMSIGGNVDVDAGGDVSELSVSLPTTWYRNPDGKSITTVGGGDLSVHAGGDILSGTYFVAKGTADIRADGAIAVSPSLAGFDSGFQSTAGAEYTTPVSTLFGLQDAQVTVNARQGADIGGVYDPSYAAAGSLDKLFPAGHADDQGYSTTSSFVAASVAGDVAFGSLLAPNQVFFGRGGVNGETILPANVALSALSGSIDILTSGSLFPSPTGNLSLLAEDNIGLAGPTFASGVQYFGLIDSSPDGMPSPLQPIGPPSATKRWLAASTDVGNGLFHEPDSLHDDDTTPVRVYALNGDITNGMTDATGITYSALVLIPSKQADIRAGRDIVNLSLIGQHTRAADITRVSAGRDIYDTFFPNGTVVSPNSWALPLVPALLVGGPGTFVVDAGRDIGSFVSQADLPRNLAGSPTGIQAVGNTYNPYLPHESADILVNFGVGPGVDTAGFLAQYLNGGDGLPSLVPDLVAFMEQRIAGERTATGHLTDDVTTPLTNDQARDLFAREPEIVQRIFADKVLFKLLAQVGTDYNNPSSPYAGKYARGYAALDSMFPGALGYTANGAGQGGLNGGAATVDTGDLDIRSSTIQTQQGGDVTLLGPGGQALIGSTSAPSQITDANGKVLAGPNTMGLLTLEAGNVNVFTDRSLLLAQSRVFTEQGGDVTIWSSNGDINAGQGAKTNSEVPPPTFLCDIDAWCRVDARGQVSGAGIATLQTVEGAPPGNAYLIAPRGTVDAGDAGIRVAGNLVIAAARVANADNIQVKGDSIGAPVTAAVNIGALNAAGAAANAASKVAEDVARKQQSDARNRIPSIISVQILDAGSEKISGVDAPRSGANQAATYNPDSAFQVLGVGPLSEAKRAGLTATERERLN